VFKEYIYNNTIGVVMWKKIWVKILAVLGFFRLVDENNVVSITNLLIYIFAFKFAYAPMESTSLQDMALALAAMGVYVGKKVVNAYADGKKQTLPSDLMDKMKGFIDEEGD
jgi:hypothetical protein